MIHLYGLTYWILKYPQQTLERLLATASEPVHITIVEGQSKNSPEFLEWGTQMLKEGKIQRYIQADTNCKGQGLMWAIRQFPPDDSENFFISTDMDLLMPDGFDWCKQMRHVMKTNSICGYDLSLENYVAPNWGFGGKNEPSFGNWLMGLDTKAFSTYPNHINFQDHLVVGHMMNYGTRHKFWDCQLYHLGWDAWKDDPEYWEKKLADMNWQSRSNPHYKVFTAST